MANPLQIPLDGHERPNFTIPPAGAQPSSGNLQARPNFTMPKGGATAMGVSDAEFRNARPIGGDPQTIKPVTAPTSNVTTVGGLKAQQGIAGKAGYLAGRAGALANSPGGRVVGKFAGAAGVVSNFNDYKLDDPEVDSSATGTFNALKQGDFAGAGRSLGKGAIEAGMDLGSFAANTADVFVPGQPFSQGYNRLLKSQFGDQLVDRTQPKAPAGPTKGATTPLPFGAPDPNQRVARNLPGASGESLKGAYGAYSPAGTFDKSYTDLGGGIGGKGSGSRGQPNDFTNIGADGKPTALSQGDSRTPDQIANGEKIKAQTAATVAAAGGLGNLQRQNSLMAANIRDGVDPHRGFNGPQVSIMQNTSGSGRGKDDLASLVKSLKDSGIKVSHNTLRAIIAAQSQQQAAQIQANASMYGHDSTSRTQLATNANTVAAQREGNQLQAESSKYGHDVTAQGNRIRQAFDQKKFGIEQGWKQVDHNRAVGNDTRQAREHGEKMFNESVGRMFPGQEGAADAAAFTKAAHHTIANHVNNLRKSGSPEAMAKAQEIEANPWSSEMMSRLAQGYQVRKTSRENHGNWGTPGSGKHVESDDLFSYTADPTRKTDKGMFDNEVPLRNGGTISENAASGTSAIKNAFGYGQRTQDQINYINQR